MIIQGKNEEKLVLSTRKDWLPAIIVIALTQKETRRRKERSTDTQDEAVLSPTGAGSRESQMRGKGNHNFQLFLSYAWSLHHADNIVLYSRACCFLVPSCRYLLSFSLSANISLIVYTTEAAADFSYTDIFPCGAFITNVTLSEKYSETGRRLVPRFEM